MLMRAFHSFCHKPNSRCSRDTQEKILLNYGQCVMNDTFPQTVRVQRSTKDLRFELAA